MNRRRSLSRSNLVCGILLAGCTAPRPESARVQGYSGAAEPAWTVKVIKHSSDLGTATSVRHQGVAVWEADQTPPLFDDAIISIKGTTFGYAYDSGLVGMPTAYAPRPSSKLTVRCVSPEGAQLWQYVTVRGKPLYGADEPQPARPVVRAMRLDDALNEFVLHVERDNDGQTEWWRLDASTGELKKKVVPDLCPERDANVHEVAVVQIPVDGMSMVCSTVQRGRLPLLSLWYGVYSAEGRLLWSRAIPVTEVDAALQRARALSSTPVTCDEKEFRVVLPAGAGVPEMTILGRQAGNRADWVVAETP